MCVQEVAGVNPTSRECAKPPAVGKKGNPSRLANAKTERTRAYSKTRAMREKRRRVSEYMPWELPCEWLLPSLQYDMVVCE